MTKRKITKKYKRMIETNRILLETRKNVLLYNAVSKEIYTNYIAECKENGYTDTWANTNWLNNIAK